MDHTLPSCFAASAPALMTGRIKLLVQTGWPCLQVGLVLVSWPILVINWAVISLTPNDDEADTESTCSVDEKNETTRIRSVTAHPLPWAQGGWCHALERIPLEDPPRGSPSRIPLEDPLEDLPRGSH